jgi:ribonucleoside-diphosphate reductase alpha chain
VESISTELRAIDTGADAPILRTAWKHDPLDDVEWVQTNVPALGNGHPYTITAPADWGERSCYTAAKHYLALSDERSVRRMIERVTSAIVKGAEDHCGMKATEARALRWELHDLLVHRIACFNSPVWYNAGRDNPMLSACFLCPVDDEIDSIEDLFRTEASIFKAGAGSGVNWSALRGSMELVGGLSTASGPLSFEKTADCNASTLKSGGKFRRAARMDLLDADHPDIERFISAKSEAERIARMLSDAGYSTSISEVGSTHDVVPFQSTNFTVRIPDDLMKAAAVDGEWALRYRLRDGIAKTVSARALVHSIAEGIWACGDPGVMFSDTANDWATFRSLGPITTSNPCGEVLHVRNISCNLAAVNLVPPGRGPLTPAELTRCARVLTVAQDAICSMASYPTPAIERQTKALRPIGIGVANLGALFMHEALPYDSDSARNLASDIMHTLTTASYDASLDLAERLGPFEGADRCATDVLRVFKRHRDHARNPHAWGAIIDRVQSGDLPRHTFTTCCMPTGTVSLLMDCDTTGVEPYFSLDTKKTLAFGGQLRMTARFLDVALARLGYTREQIETAIDTDLASIAAEHQAVFDTALARTVSGTDRFISPKAHIDMLAAIQGGVGSGISKTVNVPNETTVEEIEDLLFYAWKQGIKCLAIYRDGSKVAQPLTRTKVSETTAEDAPKPLAWGERRRLPARCPAVRQRFELGGAEFYMHVGLHPEGDPGEVFLRQGKEGSTMAGLVDAWSIAVSFALQHGAPLKDLMGKFVGLRWPPDGWFDGHYYSSPADYVARWMLENYGPKSEAEPDADVEVEPAASSSTAPTWTMKSEIHLCPACGNRMVQNGRCLLCPSCGQGQGGCTN